MISDLENMNTHARTRSSDSRNRGAFRGARSNIFHNTDTLTVMKIGRAWGFRWE